MPTSDLGFKMVLASPAHVRVTVAFIRDFFGIEVTPDQIRITDPYSIRAVQITLADGSDQAVAALRKTLRDLTFEVDLHHLIVEMQVRTDSRFVERAVDYVAETFANEFRAARFTGRSIRPVWSLNVMGGILFPDDGEPLRSFTFRDDTTFAPLLPQLLRLAFFELGKRPTDPTLEAWWHFFTTGQARPGDPEYLHEAAGIMERANYNPEEAQMATLLEREQWQLQDQLEDAHAQGHFQGRAEERAAAERQRQTTLASNIRVARAKGLGPQDIADILNLSVAEVKAVD